MKKLYFECYAGVSGDMAVAALLDLGADEKKLLEALKTLPLGGYSVKISRVKKSGLDACDFDVVPEEGLDNHDHDMEYLYGHDHARHEEDLHGHGHPHDHEHAHGHSHPDEQEHAHGHIHPHDHEHTHGRSHPDEQEHTHGHGHPDEQEHTHGHGHPHDHEDPHGHIHDHEHTHVHRNLADVLGIIGRSGITPGAKKLASDIFGILADAEAKAHGVPAEEVHFHEVGAVDSIVDIVAAAVCLDDLGCTSACISAISEGRGTVRCQHGILPVPVPAVVNIFAANRLEMHLTEVRGELVTPTGAAIMAALSDGEVLPEKYRILSVGLGAGKRDYPTSGIVRAMLIEMDPQEQKG